MNTVVQDLEVSQTDCSFTIDKVRAEMDSLTGCHNSMVRTINALKDEVARLKIESNIRQRNWNDYNIRIYNMKNPITSNIGKSENTLELVTDVIYANKLINHD